MPGFFDATCPFCKRKYGWMGEFKDRPINCPKCGQKFPTTQDDKEIKDFIQMLNNRKKKQ